MELFEAVVGKDRYMEPTSNNKGFEEIIFGSKKTMLHRVDKHRGYNRNQKKKSMTLCFWILCNPNFNTDLITITNVKMIIILIPQTVNRIRILKRCQNNLWINIVHINLINKYIQCTYLLNDGYFFNSIEKHC